MLKWILNIITCDYGEVFYLCLWSLSLFIDKINDSNKITRNR